MSERTKESMVQAMEKLNGENILNRYEKQMALSLFKNATKTGNKIFLDIPTNLLKIDHDMYQRPLQRHVRTIAKNWNDDKCDPLMVNYRNDGFFYIIDGQHRFEAALMRGISSLVCVVFVGLTIKEEADLFTEQNEGTKKLSPYDTYKANICRGDETDLKIKKVCDKFGIKVEKGNTIKTLKSVTGAREIVNFGGAEALEWVFTVFQKSGWDNFKDAYTCDLMRSVCNMRNNNEKTITRIENALIGFFINSSPKEVLAIGNAEFPQYGRTVRINMVLKDIIKEDAQNSGTKKKVKSIA